MVLVLRWEPQLVRDKRIRNRKIGLVIIAKTSYIPKKVIDFWERMRQKGNSSILPFLNIQPLDENRIKEMKPTKRIVFQ